jgi:hypothetical protein
VDPPKWLIGAARIRKSSDRYLGTCPTQLLAEISFSR